MLGVLFSGGKDSTYVVYKAIQEGLCVKCLITMRSENTESYMFHTSAIEMTGLQSEALGIPIRYFNTRGLKEKELLDLEEAIKQAMKEFGFKVLGVGALASEYQRARVKKICDSLGLEMFAPIWKIDQKEYLKILVENSFDVRFTAIGALGLDESWLGRSLDESSLKSLIELQGKYGLHLGGEGGEYETLVLDCPVFSKRIKVLDSKKIIFSENSGRLEVLNACLVNKVG